MLARGIVPYQKNIKRQSLFGKTLSDVMNKNMDGLTHPEKEFSIIQAFLIHPKDWHLVFIFSFKAQDKTRASPHHRPDSVPPALNPYACFSSTLINVVCSSVLPENTL